MKKYKKIPKFKTEAEEREFWHNHDSADYLDWKQAKGANFHMAEKIKELRKKRSNE